MPFQDRSDAGRRLADGLARYKGEEVVVFALPRGGVPVGVEIAKALHAQFDLVLVRKLGVPYQRELAMGAVADGGRPVVVRNEDVIRLAGVSDAEFESARRRELTEIERRRNAYFRGRSHPEIRGKVAIVVDDGVATGATTRAALRAVRAREPKSIVLAIPVAPPDTLASLRAEADVTICLEVPSDFVAIGQFYVDFHQLSDDEVTDILDDFKTREAAAEAGKGRRT